MLITDQVATATCTDCVQERLPTFEGQARSSEVTEVKTPPELSPELRARSFRKPELRTSTRSYKNLSTPG